MEEIIQIIQQNVHFAPFIIFGLLLLAGFNIPVSEDLMIFISATLAAKNPNHLIPLFIGVFLGAYLSDIICFYLGKIFGNHIFEIKFFRRIMHHERVGWFKHNIEKYGIFALIIGRFIPFGIRNALFLTCGLTKVGPIKFAIYDLIATTITVSIYFALYYQIGPIMIEYIKKFNIIIFSIFIVFIITYIIIKKYKKRHAPHPHSHHYPKVK